MKRKTILNKLYDSVVEVILQRQHPVTGLLPASTSVNTHGDYTDAWVRDNVYSILCVWTLGSAMRHANEDNRADELEQATIKLMRGLLISMMRQAHKVETFKHTLNQNDALHAKYDTGSGLEVVADDAWGHLQIDATSIFLLMLAQMSGSGLRIVRTYDEVDFVQNLVYYVASAYRTPDFGIWERGNKINNGKTEINASSVGMAKAALQAMDGFNVFGEGASPRAVIHSVPDAIANARSTLGTLLPRESLSKETDSALLSIIGFPAFAITNKNLRTKTRDDILAKLGGNFGCKRFLWDGHQTALEEASRLYYEHSELANFEHIESEWPLFFTYLYIHALFDGSETTAAHYREKIESLMQEVDGEYLLPELYFIAREHIEAEKSDPKSQPRVPNENVPLVWAQSLYWVGLMLDEGLVFRDDLDPLQMRRRSPIYNNTQIALVVLAENDAVKERLAASGIIAETLDNIRPIEVVSAQHLVDVYTHVGANKPLGLSGRPHRRLQSLATSQTYKINGKPYLCLSSVQSETHDYCEHDAKYLAEAIERELVHIRSQWWQGEVAVFTWWMDEVLCDAKNSDILLKTLRDCQLRTHSEYVGYASASLAIRASKSNNFFLPDISIKAFGSEDSLMAKSDIADTLHWPIQVQPLLECLDVENEATCFRTLEAFITQHGLEQEFGGGDNVITLNKLLTTLYQKAKLRGYWLVVRYCYDLLGYVRSDLTDGLGLLAARHLSLVLGKDKINNVVLESSTSEDSLMGSIRRVYHSALERTLAQEFLMIIGHIMRTEPRVFDGVRSIKIQSLFNLCTPKKELPSERDILVMVSALSPAELYNTVYDHLHHQHKSYVRGINSSFSLDKLTEEEQAQAADTDWFEWRTARGSITTLDDEFLKAIWQSLGSANTLAFGDLGSPEHTLHCEWARSSKTSGEVSFANLVDELTNNLHPTYYKSAVLEALFAFTQYCEMNPQARFEQVVVFGQVLEGAAKSFIWDSGVCNLVKRDLDVLLEQSPKVVHRYVLQALGNLSNAPDASEVSAAS